MNKNLLIIGAGEYGQITYEIAEAMGVFKKIDFLDDNRRWLLEKCVILRSLQESILLELLQ